MCFVLQSDNQLLYFSLFRVSREETNRPDSDVHIFTTHFMNTLKKDGPESVVSWTVNTNTNVFKKHLTFLPVNANVHWSLCLVVNPGLIAINYAQNMDDTEESAL